MNINRKDSCSPIPYSPPSSSSSTSSSFSLLDNLSKQEPSLVALAACYLNLNDVGHLTCVNRELRTQAHGLMKKYSSVPILCLIDKIHGKAEKIIKQTAYVSSRLPDRAPSTEQEQEEQMRDTIFALVDFAFNPTKADAEPIPLEHLKQARQKTYGAHVERLDRVRRALPLPFIEEKKWEEVLKEVVEVLSQQTPQEEENWFREENRFFDPSNSFRKSIWSSFPKKGLPEIFAEIHQKSGEHFFSSLINKVRHANQQGFKDDDLSTIFKECLEEGFLNCARNALLSMDGLPNNRWPRLSCTVQWLATLGRYQQILTRYFSSEEGDREMKRNLIVIMTECLLKKHTFRESFEVLQQLQFPSRRVFKEVIEEVIIDAYRKENLDLIYPELKRFYPQDPLPYSIFYDMLIEELQKGLREGPSEVEKVFSTLRKILFILTHHFPDPKAQRALFYKVKAAFEDSAEDREWLQNYKGVFDRLLPLKKKEVAEVFSTLTHLENTLPQISQEESFRFLHPYLLADPNRRKSGCTIS